MTKRPLLALTLGLALPALAPAAEPVFSPLAAAPKPPVATSRAQGRTEFRVTPAPHVTEMRVVIGQDGLPQVICRDADNPRRRDARDAASLGPIR